MKDFNQPSGLPTEVTEKYLDCVRAKGWQDTPLHPKMLESLAAVCRKLKNVFKLYFG